MKRDPHASRFEMREGDVVVVGRRSVDLGDLPGHEFHGNQWTGEGHGKFAGSEAKTKRGHEPGETHVAFPDGRKYVIYKDASSGHGQWEAQGLEDATAGGAAFTKQEMLDHLGKLDESRPVINKYSDKPLHLPVRTVKEHLDKTVRSRTQFKLGDFEGHPFRGNQYKDGGTFDPANKETWYRNGPGWHVSNDGERPFDHRPTPPDYEPPEVTHTSLRMRGIAIWGGSHHGSSVITGDAAKQMGIEGYKDLDATKDASAVATRMLTEIANDTGGSEEPLYHSFENVKATVFKPGDTMRLPPMAAAGSPSNYGKRLEAESQRGAPTFFVFPKGTPMVGYSKIEQKDLADLDLPSVEAGRKEFGHIWDEAIVAGGFKVDRVETVYMGSQHREHGIKEGDQIPQLYGQVVHFVPTEVYDPATQTWRPRG